MIWAFIDYENVGSLEELNLQKYDRLLVFVGPRHKRINLGDIPTDSFSRLEIIRMETTGNNNLDFHLTFYMGVAHRAADNKISFHVISHDKGFDGLINHLKSQGRTCLRKGSAKKKVAKAAAKKTATKKVAKKVAKKAVKKVAKKAAKKGIASNTSTAKIITKLRLVAQDKRPNTVAKLVNWIANSSPAGNENNAKQILENLKREGVVRGQENGKCVYP
ncbi:hypothetical protein JO972_03645 [Verrucomicrobiaceae bacterium 5K15]|uniref:PIN-like domain-containing protein n=1 Tax=Oceaniferula flava TaxID=2800421 RepID=A0AAE2SCL2_9BACT|nr:PIN domain-containing protein [Oceaniferula flavus]MBK1854035.1 hypothetical protein [Oceaniferula flavus]MBM1135341.1 hypothetical protein [Oceaniferula flavus]